MERGYRKVKVNNNKTESREDFLYKKEFDAVVGKHLNILPKLLLGTEWVVSTVSMSNIH